MSLISSWYSPFSPAWSGGIVGIALLLCILGLKLFRRYNRTAKKLPPSQKSITHIFDAALQKFSSSEHSSSSSIQDTEQVETDGDSKNAVLLPGVDTGSLLSCRIDDAIELTASSFHSGVSMGCYDRVIEGVESENLRELVKERIADLSVDGLSIEKWALGVVDFMDEISWMSVSFTSRDSQVLQKVVEKLKELLISMDCLPVDEDCWNPERQRAVSVQKNLPKGASPHIVRKGSSGLIIKGKLIRKQEVYLETSPTI
ncbi:hypothetical protein [Akkermansia massiliensis]